MVKTKNSLVFDMIKDLVLGVLGGMCISIGGTAFIVSGGGIIGALMFVVGLFIILTFNFNLFTGKICYVLDKDKKFWLTILFTYLGNIIGAVLVGYLLHVTRLFSTETIMSFAESVAQTKLQDSPLSLFVLAIFCNILIYVAVEGFNNCKNQIGKYLSLFFGVSAENAVVAENGNGVSIRSSVKPMRWLKMPIASSLGRIPAPLSAWRTSARPFISSSSSPPMTM